MTRSGNLAGGQSGMTLIEVLLAVLLISTVVVGLISGLLTSMIASSDNQDARRAEAALVSYASSVKRMPYDTSCSIGNGVYSAAYLSWPEPGKWAIPSSMTATIPAPKFWRKDVSSGQPRWSTTCPGGVDPGAQLLTLQITYKGKDYTNTIVKRNPNAHG